MGVPAGEPSDHEAAMTSTDKLRFTPEQRRRIDLMRHIAQQVTADTGDNFVFKGGTALLLAYGLPRYSTDLDFDGRRPDSDIAPTITHALETAGIEGSDLRLRKSTDTTRRYMLHYTGSAYSPLKIEISYRQADTINETDITVIDGIRVYKLDHLASLKVAAFTNRLNARDIYDVAFLVTHHPDAISTSTLAQIINTTTEVGIDQLSQIMQADQILRDYDIDQTVLNLVETAQQLHEERAGDTSGPVEDP